MHKRDIDGGVPFDWGRASVDYAKYRDIYPAEFYNKVIELGLCPPGGNVLDIGTGTGVLPRNLYSSGARFTGVDISPRQIAEAERLSRKAGQSIRFLAQPAEEINFPEQSFDAVTACQCFHYFDADTLAPKLRRLLKPGGLLGILNLEWLPDESEILAATEALVLKYSPAWSGAGYRRAPVQAPAWAARCGFATAQALGFDIAVPFTRESWNGRIRACRGVGASLSAEAVARFEAEHLAMLKALAPEEFTLPHHATMLVLAAHGNI